ncbi:uncharacterized protein LOC111042955 isoform X2 [Myzus persicae]|uniref:uncharacterized protein LOC111042955 isoform X2 n=1 Tax=Myzus persicae TaxID=13164 RepID=UPI000B93823C|nr:uncharacterized protein LOC111042955 isoform X2 [Myzus persicae]
MKNKISTFLTGLPDSVVGKQKNKNKRKEISSDPSEDNLLLKKKKYVPKTKPKKTIKTISQIQAIDDKTLKKMMDKIQQAPTHSYCIEGIVQDLKEGPSNTAGTVISEIDNFAVPPSLPSYRTLFSSLKKSNFNSPLPQPIKQRSTSTQIAGSEWQKLHFDVDPLKKSNFNSPLSQPIKQRSTSTPIAGSEWQKLHFDIDPLTPVKEFIPSSLPKQTNIEFEVISEEVPSLPTTSVVKKKCKLMLTAEKLKLGPLDKVPKFCPFCDYVCERFLYMHIETNHKEKLKLPISTSVAGINEIISNFSKNKKVLMPLKHIVDIMGDHWFNPEIRKIGYLLCNIGKITAYGGSWELNNVPEVSNPFEQFIVTSKL